MRSRPSIVFVGLGFAMLLGAECVAQTDERDTALVALIEANRHSLTLGTGLSGAGARFLEERARESDFVLIGESHGNRETPYITDQLRRRLKEHGYDVFAVETGPVITAEMVNRLQRAEGVAALEDLARRYPFGFPFFNWREEAELLHATVRDGWNVWGLDQEFVGGARYLLDRLHALAPSDRARQLITNAKKRAADGYEAYVRNERTDQAFMMTATPDDFAVLRAAMDGAPAEATWILDEMEGSAAVYQLYRSGENYESNHRRIRLMKRHFADSLAAYRRREGRDAKVLLKFGSVHMGRGYTSLNQLDLGNQAAELAYARGRESFHLTIVAAEYQTRSGGSISALEQAPYFAPLLDALGSDEGVVIDLRALRPYLHRSRNRERHEQLTEMVFRYDAVIVIPVLRSSAELVPADSN